MDEVNLPPTFPVPRPDVRYGPLELPSNVDWKQVYLDTHRHNYDLGDDVVKAFSSHMSVEELLKLNPPNMPLDNYQIFEHHGRWFQYRHGTSEVPVPPEFIDVVNNEITEPYDRDHPNPFGDEYELKIREQLLDDQIMFFQRTPDGKVYYYYSYDEDLGGARILLGPLRKKGQYVDSHRNVVYFPKRLIPKTGSRATVAKLAARIKKTNKSYDLVWFADDRMGHVTIYK